MRSSFGLKQISMTVFACLITFIIFMTFLSMSNYSRKTDEKQTDRIIDTIVRAAIQCYALEGSYPPSLDYLVEKYELILDENKYYYHYDAQLGDRLPDIFVSPKY